MKVIRVVIKTEPTAKARSRVSFRNGKVWSFTPRKTVEATEFLRSRLLKHEQDAFPIHTAVKLSATFFRRKSKYLPKRVAMPYLKPDIDNLTKTLMDAVNGILVYDDSQITTLNVRKRWSSTGEGYITIRMEVDNDNSKSSNADGNCL